MLNCFKYFQIYILGQISQKRIGQEKKLNYMKSSCIIFLVKMTRYLQRLLNYIKSLCVKITRYSQRFLNYIKSLCNKMFQHFHIIYTLKPLLSKNRFFFSFFSSTDMEKFHHLVRYHATSINSSFSLLLRTLRFSNLICQAKSLTIFL